MGLSVSLVRSIATAFGYSFFWCLATAVYLLLRMDVDQTEFDDIYVDREDPQYDLPPLQTDQAGVPGAPEEEEKPNAP